MKKRHIVSLEKMTPEVVAAFNAKYPGGIQECEDDLEQYPKPNGECFYAVELEVADDVYLVKIPVEIDSLEDVRRWLDSDVEPDSAVASTDNEPEDNTLPDDNIGQYGSEDDSEEA